MSFLSDKHAVYVLVAYGASAVLLIGLVWATIAANAKARRELDQIDRERGK